MKIDPHIFKAYDIRGIYPDQINEENFAILIKAVYTFFSQQMGKDKLRVVLGRDMRLSSPAFFKIAKNTLLDFGATVVDVGLVSTPTFYFACLKYQSDGGLQISASHNPPNWNGIKLVKRVGNNLVKIGKNTGMEKIKEIAQSQNFIQKKGRGKIEKIKTAVEEEVEFAFNMLAPKNIKKLKIVADPANAMGITYLEELFKRLPCQLVKMNFTLDGSFPAHQPDPLVFENLKDLRKKVIAEKADLGIAPDGDGDRVFFINEKAEVIPASHISTLIATELLKTYKGEKVGVDIRYVRNVSNAVKKAGGKPIIGKVGHALISELMLKENILFTGESSGHFFYRQTGFAESAVVTILMVLDILGRENKPISQILSPLTTSVESGEVNFILPNNLPAKKLLEEISQDYQDGKISWLDGLSVDYPNWRFNIRSSNTEPLIRLNIEGETANLVSQKTKELKEKILAKGAKIKE